MRGRRPIEPDFHQLPALLAKTHAGRVTELVVNVHVEAD